MQSEAAILWEYGDEWRVEPIDLDPPQQGEVLVRLVATGLCHSDEHVRTGDMPAALPVVGGHEGAGVVEAVGAGVTGIHEGDHVVFGFIPSCGRCPSCVTGHSNLCDLGAQLLLGLQLDGTSRHHARGKDLGLMCGLGTFARHTVVNEASCIVVDREVPLEQACLVGCGATTGYGSAVHAADVRPGETVAVLGIGGIGAAAVQGARIAGAEHIVAVDPSAWKREQALRFGATHSAPSVEEAFEPVRDLTRGRMCDKVVCAIGVGRGDMMAAVLAITAKRGRVVVTNIHPPAETTVSMSLLDLTLMEKQVVGSLFGSGNPRHDIPKLLELARQGQFDLGGMITTTYGLTEVNKGYEAMLAATNVRGVVLLDTP